MSSSSSVGSTGTHCLERVTPGRSSARAVLRWATLLIKVDLPTLGTPRTMTRTTLPTWPLAAAAASLSRSSSRTAAENFSVPTPFLALASSTAQPCARKYRVQRRVSAGSAWSARLRTMSRGLPAVSSSTSGLREDIGMRASTISQTASIFLISAEIMRLVLVMWPGNQLRLSICIEAPLFSRVV